MEDKRKMKKMYFGIARLGKKIFFVIFFLALFIGNIHAQQGILSIVGEEDIKLYRGDTFDFGVSKPTRIMIGNPNIIDAASASEDNVSIVAKNVGTTTFAYSDLYGDHSFRIKVLPESVDDIKRRIDSLLKDLKLKYVSAKVNEDEGKVILLGEVKTKEEKDRMDSTLTPFQDKIMNLVQVKEKGIVEIDVRVLELDRDATKTLGFSPPGAITATDVSPPVTTGTTGMQAFFRASDWTRNAFTTTLNFLIQEGSARVLSQPKLACLSGKEAELLVGGEKPIFTTQASAIGGGTSTSVEYKEYGIKLSVKPTIIDKGKIQVALSIEVSEVGTAETIGEATAPTAKAYPLLKRTVSTEIYLNDGQTLAIGGLIKRKSSEDIRKLAGLSDLPLVGALFRNRTRTTGGGSGERGDVELFITMTPRIVLDKETDDQDDFNVGKVLNENVPQEVINEYIKAIQSKIAKSAYYPPYAQEMGWQGTVILQLLVTADGMLREAAIAQSSGYNFLDKAALDVVKEQSPYVSFPAGMKALEELSVEVPIEYHTQ